MDMSWFDHLAYDLLRQYPQPPRPVKLRSMFRIWFNPVFIFLIVFTAAGFASMPYIVSVYGWEWPRSMRTYGSFTAGGILLALIMVAPLFRYLVLRNGNHITATVTRIDAQSKERAAPAFQGAFVLHMNRATPQETRIFSAWAADLAVDDVVDVLVYPPETTFLVAYLGQHESSAQKRRKRT